MKLSCVIQNNEAKEQFNKMWKNYEVFLYEDCSTDPNSNPSNTIDLVLKKLKQDGARVGTLHGKFVYHFI